MEVLGAVLLVGGGFLAGAAVTLLVIVMAAIWPAPSLEQMGRHSEWSASSSELDAREVQRRIEGRKR